MGFANYYHTAAKSKRPCLSRLSTIINHSETRSPGGGRHTNEGVRRHAYQPPCQKKTTARQQRLCNYYFPASLLPIQRSPPALDYVLPLWAKTEEGRETRRSNRYLENGDQVDDTPGNPSLEEGPKLYQPGPLEKRPRERHNVIKLKDLKGRSHVSF